MKFRIEKENFNWDESPLEDLEKKEWTNKHGVDCTAFFIEINSFEELLNLLEKARRLSIQEEWLWDDDDNIDTKFVITLESE